METYFDQAPGIYFATNDDGLLLEVNERFCAVLNYQMNELTGKKTDIFYTVATRIFQQTHFFPLLKMHGHAEEIYITLKKRNGDELPVLINAERKINNGNAVSLYTGIVVKNWKKFEDELIAAKKTAEAALNENSALLQAKKQIKLHSEALEQQMQIVKKQNEELKQFNRAITHDMQEPVRKLLVFSNMLCNDNRQHEQKSLVAKIARASDQMKNILSGLQQYVWLNETTSNMASIDLIKILLLIKQQLEKDFPEAELSVEAKNLPIFYGDWEQIHLLFYHLLSNAIRFRKDEDKAFVTISSEIIQLNQFHNIERYKYVDHLRIQVKDEGIGVNPQYANQAFDLFKRLHMNSGQGVGLSLCKKIVDNHYGNISIDSREGEGTLITILLPLNFFDKGIINHQQKEFKPSKTIETNNEQNHTIC